MFLLMLFKFNNLISLGFYQFQLIKLLVSFIGFKINPKTYLLDDLKYFHCRFVIKSLLIVNILLLLF